MQITSNAYLFLKENIEEGDLNRPEMKAKLVCTLEMKCTEQCKKSNIQQLLVMQKFL